MYEKISVVGISENCEDSNADDVLLPIKKESVVKSTNEVPVLSKKPAALKSNSISTSSDSQVIFEKLFGKEFLNSLTDLLKLLNVKGFDEIEMLWFDINRKPFVKLNKFASKHTLDILELEELPVNTSSSVRNVINKLVPVSSTAFGLENSLHTFRVNMRGSVPVGITMFHQVHDSIVKDFKESVIHNLRIIYYNRVETSANKIYSHIRRICANMSKYHHVVAVDFNGKITGYGCCSLPALYRTRCISAASSRSVTDALHEAYALNPDCIVTNCLDVMNEEVLKLLETFGKQGVRVVFPLDQSYEDVVNSVY